jgi:hypothetical protein
MEHRTRDTVDPAWFLAAVQGHDGDPPEPDDGTPPNVMIAVSLDELDGMTGDMLV